MSEYYIGVDLTALRQPALCCKGAVALFHAGGRSRQRTDTEEGVEEECVILSSQSCNRLFCLDLGRVL
jgi:hypothetical protein